jgi:hypothetical protein
MSHPSVRYSKGGSFTMTKNQSEERRTRNCERNVPFSQRIRTKMGAFR